MRVSVGRSLKGSFESTDLCMIRSKFLPVGLLMFLVACDAGSGAGSGMELIDQTNVEGYREVYYRNKSNAWKNGLYRRYDPGGRLEEEAFYTEDILDGKRILYQDSGDTLVVESYRRGEFHEWLQSFYDNGVLQLSGEYVDNVMSGVWRKYYRSGKLMETVTFSDNEENGPFTEYYENGNVKAVGNYLNGDKEHGLLMLYDEKGVLTRKMDCNEGICKTIWKED